jgi:Protein of unknown function (DUF4232)
MNLTSHLTRRVGAAAVAACAAIAIPAVALAAPGGSAASAADTARTAVPGCSVADLTVWAGVPADGSAGAFHYQLELSNVSRHSCTLFGYPGVSAVGAAGQQKGSAAIRNGSHPATLVTLAPGATSHVELQVTDVTAYPPSSCRPVRAEGLRVYPPNDRRAEFVPLSFEACAKYGPKFLSVTTTIAGTGVPGYSS